MSINRMFEAVDEVERYGKAGAGRAELLKHLNGESLSYKEMVISKCYDCMGYYSDGAWMDCEIPSCPLYGAMPYGKLLRARPRTNPGSKGRVLTEEQQAKMAAGKKAKTVAKDPKN